MVIMLVVFNEMTINVILIMNTTLIFKETLKSQPAELDFKMDKEEIVTQIFCFMAFGLVVSVFTTWLFSRRACFILGYAGVGAFLFILSGNIMAGEG